MSRTAEFAARRPERTGWTRTSGGATFCALLTPVNGDSVWRTIARVV
jgi:hypothetical protein